MFKKILLQVTFQKILETIKKKISNIQMSFSINKES